MGWTFDYSRYGAFKSGGHQNLATLRRIGKAVGLRNRYLRFVEHWDRSGTVIEIGAGDGSFLDHLRSAGFTDVSGCDLSPSYAPRSDIVIADANEFLSLKADGSIANMVAFDVFEHFSVSDLYRLLHTAREKLQPNGQLVFRVPNVATPLALLIQYGDHSHVTAFNEVSVGQIAYESGLDLVSVRPEPLSYPTSLRALVGIGLWPLYRAMTKCILAAFGQRIISVTPSMVCTLKKRNS
jgi:SAM-dependent methyltransferase